MTVDDVGAPAQFFHRFQHASGIEYSATVVVVIFHTVFIYYLQSVLKVVVIIYEIYLHAGRLDRSHFDDERMIGVIDNQIHARQTNHLMELIPAFIDISPFGHKSSDFTAFFLNCLWKVSTYIGHLDR